MADTARQTSEAFGDLEFEYNLKQLLDKDPIAALGFDPAKASYTVPQGDKYGTKYSREEDTLFYGPDTGSSKDILVHEFRHRGHQLLRNEIEKNPKAFVEKYGQDVVDFLTGKFSETEGKLYPGDRQEEFRTELSDNLEATFKKPRPSEEKLLQGIKDSLGDSANLFNDEELMTLAVKNYVKNVDNTGYVKDTTELVTKEDQEKYKNILTKVRQAASDILQQRKGYDQGGTVGKVLDFLTNPLTGDYRKKEPLSVQMADVGVEFTPVGTVSGVLDIKEELESEDPDYTDVALMVGTELLGLTPVGETGSKLIGGVKSRFKDRNLQRAADLLRKELGGKNPRNEFRDLNEARRNKSAIPYDVNERIWNETGWYVDPLDGQWRYEIDDSQAKVFSKGFVNTQTKNNTQPVITYEEFKTDPYAKVTFKLGDVLSHDELYKNYPKFKNADVELYSEADSSILGWFSQDLDRIGLNAARLNNNEELKSTLLHEIQHMIQKKEGFSRGSNKSSDEVLARLGTEKEKEFIKYGNLKNRQQQLKSKLRSKINAPTPQVRNDLIDQIQDLEKEIRSIENFLKDDDTLQYALYRGAGGEIEARLVQRRANLTATERSADQRTSENYDLFSEGDSIGGFPLADRKIMIADDSNLPDYAEGALDVARKIDDRREPGPLNFFGKLKRKYDDLFNRFPEESKFGLTSAESSGGTNFTLKDFGYYVDNPAKWGNTDWAKQKQAVAEKYAREGGKSAKKLLSGPQTAFLGIDNKKPLYLDTDFLSTLRGANDEVTDMSNPKYVDLKKSVEEEGFVPDQKGNKILIGINHKGEAFIMEGNNRVAIAKEFGAPSVKAEVKYYNGAEEVDGPYSPQNILKYASQAPRQFAEGGTVDMNQQMSFAFEDGGLRDDGMRQDPVSGNEVPSGSMASEVRDDIPAQLSEGEYVVPADVVRYYGVKFFEDIRDAAKMGLRDMEARGRIGGEPVPAGGPMNNDDLSPEEMAAISEMMGMAQGGAVDMYKQQQNMYNPPAQAVGNPMQQMNAGGTIRGYNQAGSVTSQTAEQDMLNAADAVNQSRASGTSMMGAPLGFSIYRPQAEIDAEAQGAIDEVTPEPEKVTLYSPEGVPIELELPRDQGTYEALLAQGYTTEVVAKTPQPRGSDDGGGDDPTPDPTAWMKKFDYTNANKLSEQTAELFDSKSPGLLGALGIVGGAFGAIGKMSNVAQANANIALLEAQGINTDSLKKKRDDYIKSSGLTIIQDTIPGIMDGDQLKAQVEQTIGSDLFKNTPKPSQTTPPPAEPTPPSSGGDDGPTFTEELKAKQKEESTKATSLAKAKATGIAAQAKNQGKTIAEVSQTGSKGYGDESAASVATGGQGNQGLGSGAGGMNKGGLMATKPKRKTKRQYKKGGLAGKK